MADDMADAPQQQEGDLAAQAAANARAIAERLEQEQEQQQFPVSSGAEHAEQQEEGNGEEFGGNTNNKRKHEEGPELDIDPEEQRMPKRASFNGPDNPEVSWWPVIQHIACCGCT